MRLLPALTTLLMLLTMPLATLVFLFKAAASERQDELLSLRRQVDAAEAYRASLGALDAQRNNPQSIQALAVQHLGIEPRPSPRYRTLRSLPYANQTGLSATRVNPTAPRRDAVTRYREAADSLARVILEADFSDNPPPGWRPVGQDPLAELMATLPNSQAPEHSTR